MFEPVKRPDGGQNLAHAYYIATGTAIQKGEVVALSSGAVIALADQDQDDPVLGVAAEEHDGSTAGRQVGTEILVYDDPATIFKVIPQTLSTVDSGDATSWVDAEYTGADDVFNGGKIVVVSANSVTGFAAGDVLDITDFANSGGDFTVTGAGGTIAAGITGYIYPSKRAAGSYAWDLDSDGTNVDLKTAGGEAIQIIDAIWDPKNKKTTVHVKFRLHQLGNDAAAKGE